MLKVDIHYYLQVSMLLETQMALLRLPSGVQTLLYNLHVGTAIMQ